MEWRAQLKVRFCGPCSCTSSVGIRLIICGDKSHYLPSWWVSVSKWCPIREDKAARIGAIMFSAKAIFLSGRGCGVDAEIPAAFISL